MYGWITRVGTSLIDETAGHEGQIFFLSNLFNESTLSK
jgi:hypothetical protein